MKILPIILAAFILSIGGFENGQLSIYQLAFAEQSSEQILADVYHTRRSDFQIQNQATVVKGWIKRANDLAFQTELVKPV